MRRFSGIRISILIAVMLFVLSMPLTVLADDVSDPGTSYSEGGGSGDNNGGESGGGGSGRSGKF